MISVKRFLQSAGTYFLGNVMTRLISFFLLPIYTKFLLPEDMGYFDVSTSYLNIIVPVICLEVWAAMMRFLYDYEDRAGKEKVVFNGFVIFSASVLLYVFGFVAVGIITSLRCAFFVCLYGIGLMLQNVYSYLARGMGHNRAFAVSGIVSSLINSVSNIVMILVFGLRLESLYLAMILGLFVQFCMLEAKVHALKAIKPRYFDAALMRSMLRFGLPLCLNTACYWFLSGYNKIAVSATLGLSDSGIYAAAGKFTMMVAIFANCFSLAWQEMVYSVGNEKENKARLYSTACNWCLTLLLFASLLIVPAVKVVFPLLINEQYAAAYHVVPLYMFATAISTFSGFLGNIFGAEKKTGSLFYTTLIAAAVNVFCFHLLVGTLGLQAANVGLAAGFALNIVLRIFELKKLYPDVRILYKRVLILLALHVPVFYIYDTQPLWVNLVTIVCVGLLMLYSFRGEIGDLLKKLKGKKA
ncbi:MAG: lipopolysaccharide biosynthesis protein [Clostridia bacterium]|nr:lipopolysaccharide biosynthesis protein [Clostridia bacterium]